MPIVAFGINHKTAPVAIREKVSFPPERLNEALQDLLACPIVNEAAILSTCNRTEIYCGVENLNNEQLIAWLAGFHDLDTDQIRDYTYLHPDEEGIRHLLRVASGLDSLILGEPQIFMAVFLLLLSRRDRACCWTLVNCERECKRGARRCR